MVHRDQRQHGITMRGAPLTNPFFRPEEKHVASGENNVVPPPGRGNKAMKKPAAGRRTFEANLQIKRFTGLLATGMNSRNESQAQLAKYFVLSTITTCWVGTPENGGAIRMDAPSASNTNTRWARNLT